MELSKETHNLRRRQRYLSEPAYREKVRKISREYRRKRYKNDPEFRKRCTIQSLRPKTPRYFFRKYRYGAKERSLSFELSFEEFQEIRNRKCYYCGSDKKIGIDRKDNSKGYFVENCVACCWPCNKVKGAESSENFIEVCKQVADFQR